MRVVVTGANRGIGLELVRQSLARGDSVFAGTRAPGSASDLSALGRGSRGALTVLALDVADPRSVAAFAKAIEAPIEAVINNAGTMGDDRPFESADLEAALEVFSTNALGPLRVTRALLPHLRAGKGKRVLHITSGMGSIADNRSGGYYAYRMSKAALNMASRSLAADLRADGIWSAVISPGWVKTDMGGEGAPTAVEDSARGILSKLDALDAKGSGTFLDWSSKQWPW